MPGAWTEQRRARAREIAMQVKPWLKSTGPRTPEGKGIVAQNGNRGGVRPMRRAVRRECKATIKALDQLSAWEEMEARIDAWLKQQRADGKVVTAQSMRRAGLKELRPPCSFLSAAELAVIFAPLSSELDTGHSR